MSKFSGPQHRGATRVLREERKTEALARNAAAHAERRACGHVHGDAQASRCGVSL